jgi:hypothetical protein
MKILISPFPLKPYTNTLDFCTTAIKKAVYFPVTDIQKVKTVFTYYDDPIRATQTIA